MSCPCPTCRWCREWRRASTGRARWARAAGQWAHRWLIWLGLTRHTGMAGSHRHGKARLGSAPAGAASLSSSSLLPRNTERPCTPSLRVQALLLASGDRVPYDQLCICAGARPKQLPPGVFCTSAAAPAAGGSGAEQQGGEPSAGSGTSSLQRQQQRELEEMRQLVLTIRDTDSVQRLAQRLQAARRVVVVGNGGIALELM